MLNEVGKWARRGQKSCQYSPEATAASSRMNRSTRSLAREQGRERDDVVTDDRERERHWGAVTATPWRNTDPRRASPVSLVSHLR